MYYFVKPKIARKIRQTKITEFPVLSEYLEGQLKKEVMRLTHSIQ